MKLIDYHVILKDIEREFRMVRQWIEMESYMNVAESAIRAERLIELLEVYNCGSVGGFDKWQTKRGTLQERYQWLVDKGREE